MIEFSRIILTYCTRICRKLVCMRLEFEDCIIHMQNITTPEEFAKLQKTVPETMRALVLLCSINRYSLVAGFPGD